MIRGISANTAGGVNGKGERVAVGVVRRGPKDELYENRMAISEVKVVERMRDQLGRPTAVLGHVQAGLARAVKPRHRWLWNQMK
jgi:hypothetical protein